MNSSLGRGLSNPQLASDDDFMLVDWVCIYVFLFVYVASLIVICKIISQQHLHFLSNYLLENKFGLISFY